MRRSRRGGLTGLMLSSLHESSRTAQWSPTAAEVEGKRALLTIGRVDTRVGYKGHDRLRGSKQDRFGSDWPG